MTTPKYMAVKVGNDYEIRRVDPEHQTTAMSCIAVGVLMGAAGLKLRSLSGLMLLAGGVGLSYYGWTGKNPINMLRDQLGGCCNVPEGSASYQHDDMAPSTQQPENEIDEAVMESFPASDAPAHHSSTAT